MGAGHGARFPPASMRRTRPRFPRRVRGVAGHWNLRRVTPQYQEDLPLVQPIVWRFDVAIGQCTQCGRRVQGRHPLQTSDAVGAANVHVGPSAVALVARLHKEVGMPLAKMAALLRERFGLTVTPGGLVHVLHRAARVAAPTYAALCEQIRGSPVVSPDETGWRVGAVRHWLWAFATPETTVYRICPGRGFDEAAEVLGADFDGVLVRDGWAPYRRFTAALHQTCLAHLLRRARTLSADHPHSPWAARVQAVLTDALALRDRRAAHALTDHGLAVARGRLLARLGRLLDTAPRPAGRPALRRPSRPRIRRRVRLLVGARGGRDQLACRAGHPPGRRQSQNLWRQSDGPRRADPTGPRQRHPHRTTATRRPHRTLCHAAPESAPNRSQGPPSSAALEAHPLNKDAISWLEQGVEDRDGLMNYLYAWPAWAPLRAAPRFQALLRRLNFPEATATGVAETP